MRLQINLSHLVEVPNKKFLEGHKDDFATSLNKIKKNIIWFFEFIIPTFYIIVSRPYSLFQHIIATAILLYCCICLDPPTIS